MAQIGNAENQKLNGEWGKHAPGTRNGHRTFWKRLTSKIRRQLAKKEVRKQENTTDE